MNDASIFKLLEPKDIFDRNVSKFMWDSTPLIYEWLKGLDIRKGGIAYTLFTPTDLNFKGKWADYSPTLFWGLSKLERENTLLSSCLYYLLWKDVPPYTELWIENLSAHFDFNIMVVRDKDISEDFDIQYSTEDKLIRIRFNNLVYNTLKEFLMKYFCSIRKKDMNTLLNENKMKRIEFSSNEYEKYFMFNFREIESIIKNKENTNEIRCTLERISNALKEIRPNLECISDALKEEIKRVSNQLQSRCTMPQQVRKFGDKLGESAEQLSKILIKLLLIGPYPPTALRLLSPKQFKTKDETKDERLLLGPFGGILRVYDENVPLEKLNFIYPLAYSILSNIGFRISHTFMYEFVLSHALRSAVSAIMARNMSHNIGSHVLARIETKDAVKNAVYDQDFLKNLPASPFSGGTSPQASISIDEIDGAASHIAHLNAYLRTRMDFVADIATAQKPLTSTKISFLGEMILPFVSQCLLWQKLCASHDLSEEDIMFRISVDKDVMEIESGKSEVSADSEIIKKMVKVSASVPNGIVGCQALYCIIENFVRNTVKHSKRPDNGKLEISVRVDMEGDWKDNERLMKVVVHDNWKACEANPNLIDDINSRLREKLIRSDGSLIARNRGLKEMKAAAAYLRGLSPEVIDNTDIEPPLLKPVCIDGNLGYELFLLRPKDLFVLDPSANVSKKVRKHLLKQGVEIVKNIKEVLNKSRDYAMLLIKIKNNDEEKILEELKNSASDLPLRVIVHSESTIKGILGIKEFELSSGQVQELLQDLWNCLRNGDGMAAVAYAYELWIKMLQDTIPLQLKINEGDLKNIDNCEQPRETDVLYARHGHKNGESAFFYEPYQKGDPIAFVLENPPTEDNLRKVLSQQLIEAGILPVIILDERVQEAACSESRDVTEKLDDRELKTRSVPFTSLLRLMRVYVPDKKEINLESKELTLQQIEEWLNNAINTILGKHPLPPLLVIHQGILDVVGLQEAQNAQNWIDKIKENTQVCDVIVTSGRGVPDNVPPKARFLPLSTIMLYTVERKGKFHLVQALLSARRPEK